MQPVNQKTYRDPSPSRVSYRWQRLWLTPFYRALIRSGIPAVLICILGVSFLRDADVQKRVSQSYLTARTAIEERPEFQVNQIAVIGASDAISKDIVAATGIELPVSSFRIDLVDLKSKIENLNAVQTVGLFLRNGGVMEVQITERDPVAIWRTAEGLILIDSDGHRTGTLASRLERKDLPLIVGEGVPSNVTEARQILAVGSKIEDRVRGLRRVGNRRWDVVLDRAQVIMLPEKDAVHTMERVIALNRAQDILERDVSHIDMRDAHRPILRLTPYATGELSRLRTISVGGKF